MTTIRRRLLMLLLPALAALMLVGGVVDYWVASATTRDAYDQGLASSAQAAAVSVRTERGQLEINPVAAQAALTQRSDDGATLFSILGPRGDVIAGTPELPVASPQSGTRSANGVSFSDASFQGTRVRVATLRAHTDAGIVTISVAETLQRRMRTQQVMLIGKLLVDFAELDITLLVVWIGISYGLRPLTRLRERIERLSTRVPERIEDTDVPGELRPLTLAFNQVLELLHEAAQAQRRFVADAAHQLRTPLAGLLAQSEVLRDSSDADDVRERLSTINRGVQRVAHTANQLLALARADTVAATSDDFMTLDLRPLVEQSVERNIDRAVMAKLDLGVDVRAASVTGNAWLLEDLLGNLVDNALKYTPAGGRVTVRCGMQDAHAFLEVEDDGPGIPEAERPRVRERFYRRPGTAGTGCGLGLAIVDEIAVVHGARFTIESPASGTGSRMRVRFPLAT